MKKSSILTVALSTVFAAGVNAQVLVADYKFNGGAALDASPNALHGFIRGGVTPANGQAGFANTALNFNGTNGYVAVPSQPVLNLTRWTMMANIKFNGFYSGNCQSNRIAGRGVQFSNTYYGIQTNDNLFDGSCFTSSPANQQFFGEPAGSPTSASTSTTYLNTGQWYCLTATYDGAFVNTYINGVLEESRPWTNQHSGIPTTDSLLIGHQPDPSFPYWVNGVIDRLRIWDDAMSASDVSAHCDAPDTCSVDDINFCSSLNTPFTYTFTPSITPPTASVQWDFGDGSPTVITSGNNPVNHTYTASASSYTVSAQVGYPTSNSFDACSGQKSFDMCVSAVGAKSSKTGSGNQTQVINLSNTVRNLEIGDVYPNPANSTLNVPVIMNKGSQLTIRVLSMDGRIVQEKHTSVSPGKTNLQLGISELGAGSFILELDNGVSRSHKPFVKN